MSAHHTSLLSDSLPKALSGKSRYKSRKRGQISKGGIDQGHRPIYPGKNMPSARICDHFMFDTYDVVRWEWKYIRKFTDTNGHWVEMVGRNELHCITL